MMDTGCDALAVGWSHIKEDNVKKGGVERVNLRWPLRCDE
jgi:hypothetical protein